MKKAIVTGATGFIGSYMVKELINNNYEVLAIVREDTKNLYKISDISGLNIINCNLENLNNYNFDHIGQYDYFFHMAWSGVSGQAQTDYNLQISNIQASIQAMNIAKKLGCKRFIAAGSIHEIECIKEMSGNKEIVFQGHSYKIAKLTTHYYCKLYASKLGIDFLWPLLTNTYGVGENSPRLINTLIRKLLDNDVPALTQGDQLYDFIYISDAVRAYRLIAEKGISYQNYIIGSGNIAPLRDYLIKLRDIVNPDISLGFGKHQYNGIYLLADDLYNKHLLNDTGFKINVSFEHGIKKTMEWVIESKNENLYN